VLPDTPQHFVYNRAISLAVAEVLAARCAEAALRIKWPNDIECNGKKICGILLQSLPGRRTGLVLGVGVNITTRCEQFPAAIAHRATSLYLETGMDVSIEAVYEELLDAFCRWCVVPVQTAHQAYTARLRGLDTRVMVDGRPAWFHGVAADGRACVTVDGRTTYVSHAGIRFDPVRARTTAKERTT
jgi:BirA family biotin operon repressor/biotin-[acetyl-CoA-carboxylase] ligase